MCYDDHIFQEIIDGEYSGDTNEVMNHINQCDDCKKRYESMKAQESFVAGALNLGLNMEKSLPTVPQIETKQPKRRKIMNKFVKRFASAAAVLLIVAGVIFIEPINAKASELLQLFRMNELDTVSITEEDIREINKVFEQGKGEIEIEDFIKVSASELGEHQSAYDFGGATLPNQFSNMLILQAPENSVYDYYEYSPGALIDLTLHVDKANEFLKYIGEDTVLPDALDQKSFTLHIGESLFYGLKYDDGIYTQVLQTDLPEIEIPNDVSEQELLDILFSLNLLPDNIKEQLQNMQNLTSTAPIPVLTDQQVVEEITILGEKSIVVRDKEEYDYFNLYFIYSDKLVTIHSNDELDHVVELVEGTE